ncbi:universal stress protein UspB [Xenorhabdus sp. PB61.4]|uniref:universal stress protein UspB n=1 Tax=Xenorhabdus TaxID=626 RepID=UPI000C057823|nr:MULTISPECIES: universal stress protein UspB [unclassified Xenorhabdus]MCC8365297.1 universal stress protein UspB [Xenorhabdus sp. PB61.4]PHM68621.1 universal stress protein UspB [Xenorhabdus sp. KJ12.1]
MFSMLAFFWAICIICIINILRYISSLRALLFILRQADPMLYQAIDGNGFFTGNGQFSKQMRLVRYINTQGYLNHHNDDVIFFCERLRKQFILTKVLCGIVLLCLVGIAIV